jgi:hypothetical protein
VIRTVSVAATFGQPLDVTLDELRVELFFTLDAEAEEAMRQFVQTLWPWAAGPAPEPSAGGDEPSRRRPERRSAGGRRTASTAKRSFWA